MSKLTLASGTYERDNFHEPATTVRKLMNHLRDHHHSRKDWLSSRQASAQAHLRSSPLAGRLFQSSNSMEPLIGYEPFLGS